MKRRNFNKTAGLTAFSIMTGLGLGCKNTAAENVTKQALEAATTSKKPFFKLSLAQWSLHKAIHEKRMDPFDFATKAKSLGFQGLEYVNHLYSDHYKSATTTLAGIKSMTDKLLVESKAAGMENLIVMIDGEGDLGIQNKTERLKGVDNHKKWVDAAATLGCHSIRVNLFGDGTIEEQIESSADSMRLLAEYAKDQNVSILVENHGGQSSDPHLSLIHI